MQDAYLPGPVELITDIFTLGIVLIIGLSIWLAVKECYERIDKWFWKRRSAKWERERLRSEQSQQNV